MVRFWVLGPPDAGAAAESASRWLSRWLSRGNGLEASVDPPATP